MFSLLYLSLIETNKKGPRANGFVMVSVQISTVTVHTFFPANGSFYVLTYGTDEPQQVYIICLC